MTEERNSEPSAGQKTSLLYKDRAEWADVSPIYNSDAENAVVKIATSQEFDDAFAFLRALMNTNEMSERALELTKSCIALNAANYTVWQYRRQILRALGADIAEELDYCEEVIDENPKNYQVWHHRKMLVNESGQYSGELEFTAVQLQDEPKNYHVWQYRQWIVERFSLYSEDEFNFSTQCLLDDIRNNSAWNYRYFIGANLSDCFKEDKFLQSEIDFTLACINKVPSNESAWSYLSGILLNDPLGSDRPEIVQCCKNLLARDPPCRSSHLYIFLIDSLADKIEKCQKDSEKQKEYFGQANKHLDMLENIDPVRHNFWQYKRTFLQNLINK